MKKALKRNLSLILAVTIIFSSAYVGLSEVDFSGLFVPMASAASESDLTFTLSVDGTYYSITGCDEDVEGELVIPDKYNDLPIEGIEASSFYNCVKLTSVVFPDSIMTIGKSAFYGCTGIESISICKDVMYIGESAFECCENISYVFFSGTEEDWSNVFIGDNNEVLKKAVIHYESLGHVYEEKIIEPTCLKNGLRYNECTVCNHIVEIEDIISSGHNYSTEWTIDKEATCTEDGSKSHHCTVCDEKADITVIVANGHNYNEVEVLSEPTCTTDGERQIKCSFCGDVSLEVIASKGHSYSAEWTTDKEATCTEDGSKSQHCTVCNFKGNVTVIAATGHSYSDWIVVNEPTCTGESLKHKTCSKCNDVVTEEGSPLGHNYSEEWIVDIEPTCTVAGSKSHHCSRCSSKSEITSIDATGHDFVDAVCSVCGAVDSLSYTAYDNHVVITGRVGDKTDLIIPDFIDGLPVTEISDSAFANCTNLTSVTIGKNITKMGQDAFYECDKLEAVHIKDIEAWCGITFQVHFSNPLYYAKKLYLNGTLVTEVTIPNSVTSIGDCAFRDCTSLTSITLHDGITTIGIFAFANCTNLTAITIPNSVTSIDNYAFSGCTSITSITIPDSVTSIDSHAFDGCTSLTSITIPNSVTIIDYAAFCNCTSLTEITIPDSVTCIYPQAFSNCTSLTEITIPDSVTFLGGAFFDCTNLVSITLPNSITSIDGFSGCTSLTSITIPSSVTRIEGFSGCTSLTSITLPSSVTSIGDSTFRGCTYLETVEISDGLVNISDLAFYDCINLTSITIPDSVRSIGEAAFYHCSSLPSISIPEGVPSIKGSTFSGCTNLKSVDLPSSITCIEAHAFNRCKNLTVIDIPKGVTSIGYLAFYCCINLNNVYIYDLKQWCNISFVNEDSNPLSNGSKLYVNGSLVQNLLIPDGVTRINDYAFSGCKSIISVILPDGAKCIGNSAFKNCDVLKSAVIPDSVTTIYENAFSGDYDFKEVYYGGDKKAWSYIDIHSGNECFTNAYINFNADMMNIKSDLLSNDYIILRVYDKEIWNKEGVSSRDKVAAVNNCSIESDGEFIDLGGNIFLLKKGNIMSDVIIKANEYKKYIVPVEALESWEATSTSDFYVFMTKGNDAGTTCISSVFARVAENDFHGLQKYVDVVNEELSFMQGGVDVVISAVEEGSKVKRYYLYQDETHKIDDEDGVFSAADLYSVFAEVEEGKEPKPITAFAVLENGDITPEVPVLLNRITVTSTTLDIIEGLEQGKVNIFGEDWFKITISEDVPLIGGASLTSELEDRLPIGIEIENERVRISIGVDIFKYEDDNGDEETTWLWENFKNSINTLENTIDDSEDKVKELREFLLTDFDEHPEALGKEKYNFDVSLCGYAEFYISNGRLVLKEVGGTVAFEVFWNIQKQFLVYGIPAIYAYVKAGGDVAADIKGVVPVADEDVAKMELEIEVKLNPSLKIGGGIGVKDAISAGIWGKATAPIAYNFMDTHFTVGLKGELGLEAEFFMLKGDVPLLEEPYERSVVDTYFDSSKKPLSGQSDALYSGNIVDVFKDGEVSLVDFSYLENTSEWLGGQSISPYSLRRTVTPESVKFDKLQGNVYRNSQTQLVQFGDTMLMAWIEGRKENDGYNVMRLVYSVYDSGAWSEPQAVADNGKCDAAPSLATDGENVYIAWQNIDYTVLESDFNTETTTESTLIEKLMKNAEIRTAKYNAETGRFEDVITVTDNNTYDYAPKVNINNGVAEVYWVNSASLDFAKGTLSILKSDFNGTTQTVHSNLNYIHSVDSSYNADSEAIDVSYTMDEDGNTSTVTDVKVYTNGAQVSVDYDTGDFTSLYATYALLDGKETLFYADDANLCYIQNGEEKVVFDSPRNINGNLQICSDGTKTTAMWLEAGEFGNELYTCTYENGEWTLPVQLTDFSKVLSNVALTYFDGKIYGVFNRTNLVEVTSEVDGSIYYKNGETDLCYLTTEGFTDVSLSVLDINESQFVSGADAKFTVRVKNNGTEKINTISFVVTDGNGYSKTIEKTVDLCSGDDKRIELTYTVPDTISQTELSVYASVPGDVNEEDNGISESIGTADISIGEIDVKCIGNVCLVSGIVCNNNSVPVENVWVNACLGEATDENMLSTYIGKMEPKELYKVEFTVDYSLLDFSEDSFNEVVLDVTSSAEEKITFNNKATAFIKEPSYHIHSYSEWIIEKEATCTEDGSKYKSCSKCGEKIVETISATNHSYSDEWVIEKEATCTEDGSKYMSCSECGEKFVEIISATNHSYSDEWVIDSQATCTENGSKSRHCLNCEDKTDVTIIEAIGHIMVNEICYNCAFSDLWEFEKHDGHMVITEYKGNASDIVLPDVAARLPITTIGAGAFDNEILAYVKISDTVTTIESNAFSNCSLLQKIIIPEGVTDIGDNAFVGFDGVICCVKGSAAHDYAIANNIDFVFLSTIGVSDLVIDTKNFIARTDVEGCTDFPQTIKNKNLKLFVKEASHSVGKCEYYGTGTVVSVFNGDYHVGDFTLVVNGDVNGDSIVDALDAMQVGLVSNGHRTLDGVYALAADSNSDDVIDVTDYQSIVNKAVS